jgi:ABC-type amino acid transport substrate-binding protein
MKNKYFLIGALLLLAGCDDSPKDKKNPSANTIVMATSADMPPFEFHRTDSKGSTIMGYDIDVAQALSKELGLTLEIRDMDFNSLIPAMQSGRADFVMSSMESTPERLKNVSFSAPYLVLPLAVITGQGKTVATLQDLKGMVIGVQLGSTHEQFARDLAKKDPSLKIISLNKLGELIQELLSGRIGSIIMETKTARSFQKANPSLKVTALEEHTVKFSIAFPKNSPWLEKFNEAIRKLQAAGTFETLKIKWFSEGK